MDPAPFTRLVIVVPTRNRAELAVNAIRSVLAAGDLPVELVTSDNSTSEPERARLRAFCEGEARGRVRYVAPPAPLSMTHHYNWVFSQVMDLFPAANHFTLLTDRMVFRPGELPGLAALVGRHPGRIITYQHDGVDDYASPIRLNQVAWSGELWEVPAAALLALSARAVVPPCSPHLMNNVAPRAVLEGLGARYGNLFDSVAPDFNFCYRSLEMVDSILFYDKAPLLHYALHRSNGESQTRGIASKDHVDFMAQLNGRSYAWAAPAPEVLTVGNAIMHEYCCVRNETRSPKLPEIDRAGYLRFLADDVARLQNPELKRQMRAALARAGWKPSPAARIARAIGGLRSPRRLLQTAARRLCGALGPAVWTRLARWLGRRPPVRFFAYGSVEEAMEFDRRYPRPRQAAPVDAEILAAAGASRVEPWQPPG